jgi:hypothetical protein
MLTHYGMTSVGKLFGKNDPIGRNVTQRVGLGTMPDVSPDTKIGEIN